MNYNIKDSQLYPKKKQFCMFFFNTLEIFDRKEIKNVEPEKEPPIFKKRVKKLNNN